MTHAARKAPTFAPQAAAVLDAAAAWRDRTYTRQGGSDCSGYPAEERALFAAIDAARPYTPPAPAAEALRTLRSIVDSGRDRLAKEALGAYLAALDAKDAAP